MKSNEDLLREAAKLTPYLCAKCGSFLNCACNENWGELEHTKEPPPKFAWDEEGVTGRVSPDDPAK